jgi:putative transposase
MARPLRIMFPDAWYHVMNRGRHREPVFEARDDYECFVAVLHEAVGTFALRVSAYCLMPNHYHLLVQTPDANLDRCMRHINGIYTQRYNRAHGLDGTLFRGRYKATVVAEDPYLLQLVRYIHRNPVRAGMAENAGRYEWSSHKGYLSRNGKWDWLHKEFILSMLALEPEQREKRYRAFMGEEENKSFLQAMASKKVPSILGDHPFIERLKERFFEQKRHLEVPESKTLAPDVAIIKKALCEHYRIAEEQLYVTRRGAFNEARAMGLYLARQLRGEPLQRIGGQFGVDNYSTVSTAIERFKARLKTDRSLAQRVDRIEKLIMNRRRT